MLENAVFLELKRHGEEVYYSKGKNECDFLIKKEGQISEALQVCYELTKGNKEREINGFVEAMEKFKAKKGTILTLNQKEKIHAGTAEIDAVPVWEWALNGKAEV
ncbi:Uncharacterised protein [uncultured archaeon]|nr:Uncharacterised protein [uncultured archaeon]